MRKMNHNLKILFLSILFLSFGSAYSQEILDYRNGWEYNWDFTPMNEKFSDENSLKSFSQKWKPYVLGRPVPERNGRNILWIRNRIPKIVWERPAIYFRFIEFTYEAFIGNTSIYKFGDLSENGSCRVDTWIQHQIIPFTELKGDFLYIRICSPYPSIGISGIPKIGNSEALYRLHILSEIPLLAFGIFFIVCFLFSLYFFMKRTSEKLLFYFSMICLVLSLVCVYHTSFRLEILNQPKSWTSIMQLSAILLTVFMAYFIECLTGPGWKMSIVIVRKGILLFGLFSTIFLFIDRELKYQTHFAVSFFFLQMINVFVVVMNFIFQLQNKKREVIIFIISFSIMLVSILLHFLYEIGKISYWFFYFPVGFVFFVIGLGWIAGERYSRVYDELQDYNENLERKIGERAIQIEDAHKIALENGQKIAELEKENALIQEREKIFTDMHDHMGYLLSDMRFQIRNLKVTNKQEEECKKDISASLEKVIQGFRNRLNSIEDLKIMKKDFINGLRLIVFRRYENAERKIQFNVENEVVEYFLNMENEKQKEILYAIVQEICTNDLKYGEGVTDLSFSFLDHFILIHFSAISTYHSHLLGKGHKDQSETFMEKEKLPGKGHGTKNIISRVSELKGFLSTNIQGNVYNLEIQIPK